MLLVLLLSMALAVATCSCYVVDLACGRVPGCASDLAAIGDVMTASLSGIGNETVIAVSVDDEKSGIGTVIGIVRVHLASANAVVDPDHADGVWNESGSGFSKQIDVDLFDASASARPHSLSHWIALPPGRRRACLSPLVLP